MAANNGVMYVFWRNGAMAGCLRYGVASAALAAAA